MSKIIIVDDHLTFRKGLHLMLKEIQEVKEIAECENGLQFLSQVEQISPDLVFMDIRLPGMSGIEAAVKALKQNSNLRIIILTMFGEEKYLKEAMEAGVKGFLLKPPTLFQLRVAYQTVMQDKLYFPTELRCQ
ncbi:MAG: response regulator transcription factor [Ignavibacteria bacterium]|nr:response regulator transcription factor [Ignavibacteria bacterium]